MTSYAHNGEIRIAFDDLGGAGGDPLLLVIGLGTTRFWWPDGLVAELVARGFHVVAYDQRDAGESTHLPDRRVGPPIKALLQRKAPAYSVEDFTDDAVAVLDAVGWQSAHLFGHSMGGLIAQRVAIRHPRRVLSLATSSAVPSDAKGLRVLRYLRLSCLPRFARLHFPETPQGNLDLAVALARILAAPGQHIDEHDVREFVDKEAAHQVSGLRDPKAQSRQIGAKWHSGPLADITAPTLVLHGEQDPVLRVSAARHRRRRTGRTPAPGAVRRPLPRQRHLDHLRRRAPRPRGPGPRAAAGGRSRLTRPSRQRPPAPRPHSHGGNPPAHHGIVPPRIQAAGRSAPQGRRNRTHRARPGDGTDVAHDLRRRLRRQRLVPERPAQRSLRRCEAQIDLAPEIVYGVIQRIADSCRRPPLTVADVIESLDRSGLVSTAAALHALN